MSAEKVITAKQDEPDAYFGLKVGAVLSPSYGYRVRNSDTGLSNAKKDDRTGFSSPWTLLMISKDWEDRGITAEFWGEIARSSTFSSDTKADSGTKSNPYAFLVRRANVQKKISVQDLEIRFILGIQELPSTYTQWKGYWNWRYVDRGPLESLELSPAPADLGATILTKWKFLSAHMGAVNGEGYREMQNTSSSGYDLVGRISAEQEFEKLKLGLHFFGKAGNIAGVSGDECHEGKTSCLASDGNSATRFVKDLRSQKSSSYAAEFNLLYAKFLNIGAGALFKRQFRGKTYDQFHLENYPVYQNDLSGRAGYFWTGFSWDEWSMVFRQEKGAGSGGILSPVYEERNYLLTGQTSSKSSFRRSLLFFEYIYSDTFRISFGGSETRNFDTNGEREKVYMDAVGDQKTKAEYSSQFSSSKPAGISAFDTKERSVFLRTTLEF